MDYEVSAGEYIISTDSGRLQTDIIWQFLHHESTWARGIPYAVVRRTLDHSLNFGLYTAAGRQVGFARVVTDYGQFAYLCDVFVLSSYRGHGLGKALVHAVMNHPGIQELRRYALDAEDDSRTLYGPWGFAPVSADSGHMEITRQPTELWPS